jgi:hypothetical protein
MLTKSQSREVAKIKAYAPTLGASFAARSLSALHRSAMRASQQAAILAVAVELACTNDPEFLI